MDDTKPRSHFWNPIAPYTSITVPQVRLGNTPQLGQLLRDGKIYLSLSDAVTLALENNYDIEIARINLDIADTDILRTKAGGTIRGISTGLVTNTIGGTTSTIVGGGGPGGTSSGVGGGLQELRASFLARTAAVRFLRIGIQSLLEPFNTNPRTCNRPTR